MIAKIQIHIPATVFLDVQAISPQHLFPKILRDASEWYIEFSGDPLIIGAFHGGPEFNWFRSFLYLEACVQQGHFTRNEETNELPFLGSSNCRCFSSPRGRYTPVHQSHRFTTTHARLFRFVVHHNIHLSCLPLDIHRPDSVPNVTLIGKLRSVLLGAVRNGNRHDDAPDEGSANQNSQVGVIEGQ